MKKLINGSTIVGLYATDAAMLSNSQTSQPYWLNSNNICALRYLPVLDYIRFNQNEEFTFCTDKHSEGLQAYNENNRLHPLSAEAIRDKKLNVTVNDLFCGDIDMVLNFTGRYITATADTGIAKMFAPLDPTKFGELDGSIVVVSIVTLNSPSAVKDVYGYNDYIASLMTHTAGKTDYFSNENNRLFTFVNACITTNKLSARILSNTLKVVRTYTIEPSQLNIKEKESVYLYRKRIAFSFASILEVPPHPEMTQEYINHRGTIDTIRANGVSCFIVDNHDALSERYYNFAGTVCKVPKMKDADKSEGLYIISIDSGKTVTVENIIPLDKVDENNYIYRSMEEANSGADMRTKYSDEFELDKLAMNQQNLVLKHELEEKKRSLELQSVQQRLEFEASMQRLKNEEALFKKRMEEEQAKLRMELERNKASNETLKQETDRFKFGYDIRRVDVDTRSLYNKGSYEEGKYQRDSTIESIKTVGAVAGLVLAGMMIYSKSSK